MRRNVPILIVLFQVFPASDLESVRTRGNRRIHERVLIYCGRGWNGKKDAEIRHSSVFSTELLIDGSRGFWSRGNNQGKNPPIHGLQRFFHTAWGMSLDSLNKCDG